MNRHQKRKVNTRLKALVRKFKRGKLTALEQSELSELLALLGENVRVTNAPADADPAVLGLVPGAEVLKQCGTVLHLEDGRLTVVQAHPDAPKNAPMQMDVVIEDTPDGGVRVRAENER